jgi:hypothetical protein
MLVEDLRAYDVDPARFIGFPTRPARSGSASRYPRCRSPRE